MLTNSHSAALETVYSNVPTGYISPADCCEIQGDCAFDDKSMKLGTVVDKVLTKIFFDRDIAILPRG